MNENIDKMGDLTRGLITSDAWFASWKLTNFYRLIFHNTKNRNWREAQRKRMYLIAAIVWQKN